MRRTVAALGSLAISLESNAHANIGANGWQLLGMAIMASGCLGLVLSAGLWALGFRDRRNLSFGTLLIAAISILLVARTISPTLQLLPQQLLQLVTLSAGLFIFFWLNYVCCWTFVSFCIRLMTRSSAPTNER